MPIANTLAALFGFGFFISIFFALRARSILGRITTQQELRNQKLSEQLTLLAGQLEDKPGIRAVVAVPFDTEQVSALLEKIKSSIEAALQQQKSSDEMLTNLSHDLRSPLTSLMGYIDTLIAEQATLTPEKNLELLHIAQKSAESLKRLIFDLYDVNRIESGTAKPNLQTICFSDLVSDIVSELSLKARAKNLTLTFLPPESSILLQADGKWMERALRNIIENALYYTKDSGNVTVSITEQSKSFEVAIADTGIGIPQKDLPHVFDEFFRVNRDRSRSTGGAGLGLAIAKKIINAHSGDIRVESKEGSGSTFYVTLKKRAASKVINC